MNFETLSIRLTPEQFNLLSRIAESDDRRIEDLSYLLLSTGLTFFYSEKEVCFKKEPHEFTEKEKIQLKKNKELDNDSSLKTFEERKKKGWKNVEDWHRNFSCKDNVPNVVDDLAKSISTLALNSPFPSSIDKALAAESVNHPGS